MMSPAGMLCTWEKVPGTLAGLVGLFSLPVPAPIISMVLQTTGQCRVCTWKKVACTLAGLVRLLLPLVSAPGDSCV